MVGASSKSLCYAGPLSSTPCGKEFACEPPVHLIAFLQVARRTYGWWECQSSSISSLLTLPHWISYSIFGNIVWSTRDRAAGQCITCSIRFGGVPGRSSTSWVAAAALVSGVQRDWSQRTPWAAREENLPRPTSKKPLNLRKQHPWWWAIEWRNTLN